MFKNIGEYLVEFQALTGVSKTSDVLECIERLEDKKPWAKDWTETNPVPGSRPGYLHPDLPDHHPVQALALARMANSPEEFVDPDDKIDVSSEKSLMNAYDSHKRALDIHRRTHAANRQAAIDMAQSNPEQAAIHAKLAAHSEKRAHLHQSKIDNILDARDKYMSDYDPTGDDDMYRRGHSNSINRTSSRRSMDAARANNPFRGHDLGDDSDY